MSLATWNGNLSAYDNVKSNVLADRMAKNRWGSKFKRLYNPLRDAENRVDFTTGMLNCVGTDVHGEVADLEALRDGLNDFFRLSDGSSATPNSYFSVLTSVPYVYAPFQIDSVKCSLSLSVANADDDQRRVSRFYATNGVSLDAEAYLEPIDSYFERVEALESGFEKPFYSTNQLSLYTKDGTAYGHIGAEYTLAPGTKDNNILSLYGVEEESELFKSSNTSQNEFDYLFSTLKLDDILLEFARASFSLESQYANVGKQITIVFGADLVLAWVNEKLSSWYAYLSNLDQVRGGKELELIEYLNLCDTLQQEIGSHAGEISNIWFEFKKEVKPPKIIVDGGADYYDSTYEWWKEEQFQEIGKHFKDFHLYFDFIVGQVPTNIKDRVEERSYVVLKSEAFTLSGWKIYWLVSACLGIDSRAKKASFLERIFSFVLLVVALYLTVVSANPVWLKVVLVGITLASYSGALSPKAQLVVAVVMFVYGLSATNIAAMSTAQLFQWAVSNIEMVYKMVKMYEQIKLDEEQEEDVMVHEKQERIMQFIYEDAYSQYDNLYSVMYDYEPKYK